MLYISYIYIIYTYTHTPAWGNRTFSKAQPSSFSQTVSGMTQLMGINKAAGGESNIQVLHMILSAHGRGSSSAS